MGALLRNIFHYEIPPDPAPPKNVPDESELRWSRSKIEAIKRRARELQIDVDIKDQGFSK